MVSIYKKLREAIRRFDQARVLVIGDIILDRFIWGTVSRISPEAPVPIVNVTHDNDMLGGAANVLHNLYGLGARGTLCGVIGADNNGDRFLELVNRLTSPTAGILRVDDRPTMVKTRIVAHSQQVVRFDRERTEKIPERDLDKIIRFLDQSIPEYDAVVISDYAKGMISKELMLFVREKLASCKKPLLIIDPKPAAPDRFFGATIVTPNHHEAEVMTGITIMDDATLKEAAIRLQNNLKSKAVLITRGSAGMALWVDDEFTIIPTVAREVYDVTGAGDTVIASLTLGLAAGLSFHDAALLANYAAGIVVGKVGTATVSAQELDEVLS